MPFLPHKASHCKQPCPFAIIAEPFCKILRPGSCSRLINIFGDVKFAFKKSFKKII